jgi:AraC family transcriptional regulator
MENVAYGQHLATALHVGKAQTLVARRSLRKSQIAVTDVRRDIPENDYTSAVPQEDAFLVTLNVRDWSKRVLWIDDKPVRALPLKAGTSNIFDLRKKYIGYGISAFHMMSFYLPREVLAHIAEMDGSQGFDEFAHDPCSGIDDAVIRELGFALYPALKQPDEANLLFVDHITTAIAAHVLHAYTPSANRAAVSEDELSEPQAARVKEVIAAHLDGNVSVSQLAQECSIPLGRFSRAFTNSVGMPPHKWLLERRLEKAMDMMRRTQLPLAEIAALSGFAGERHLARVFSRAIGDSPQAWRRARLS